MAYSRSITEGSDEDYRRSVPGGSGEDNSRSVKGGSNEDYSRSVLGGSEGDNSRSVQEGSHEDYSRSVLGGSEEDNSRSVQAGSDEDYSRSVLGGSEEDNSRSVQGSSHEDYSRSVLGGSDEDNSRSVQAGSHEDYSRSVLGGSEEDNNGSVQGGSYENYSRSVLGGSAEDYSRSVLVASEEYFSRTLLGGYEEVNDIHCEPCKKEGNTVDAVKHCVNCAEYFCGQCFKSHAKLKAFQSHVTNDVKAANAVTKKSIKITTVTVRYTLSELQIDPKTDQQISIRVNAKSSKGPNKTVTAKLVSSFDVRSKSDKQTPHIQGFAIVRSHYCVVIDDDNKSIKVVDTRRMCIVSEIHISDADDLYGISSVNSDRVAALVEIKDEQYKLMFFSVSTSGIISHTDRSLDIGTIYQGIIHHKNRFYASDDNNIHVISMNGQIFKTIYNNAFGGLDGIALSNDHNTIYVCSRSKDTVFSVDLEGNIKATYKDQDLKGPDGVTVDSEGYVYVCSNDTDCVHQLTADLYKVQVIISGVHVRRCIFNRSDNRLYLPFCDKINIYNINHE